MPKMHQHMFSGRALPRPAYAHPIPISRNAGPTSKGNDREEREKRWDGKGGEGDPPKSM